MSKLKTTKSGPMDKFLKEIHVWEDGQPPPQVAGGSQAPNLQHVAKPCDKVVAPSVRTPLTQRQLGTALAPSGHPLDEQKEEPHTTHSFEWWGSDKKSIILTCNRPGTVEDALKRSPQFRNLADKNKNRELVIVRDGKAISPHLPCSLIEDTRLTIRYIKAANKSKQSFENRGYDKPRRKGPSDKVVMFHVLTKGGKNVQRLMRNPALGANINEITVYAYKGEKVKQALKRDGRFLNIVFKKNCGLLDTSTEVTTEMSNLVDDLNGKIFQIVLLNKLPPPESPPGSLDDAYMMQNDSQGSDSDENNSPPQQSTTTESVDDNTPEERPELNGGMAPEKNPNTVPGDSSLQFKIPKTPQISHINKFFPVEYRKNSRAGVEVKIMKKLTNFSNSVCHVRINGSSKGSGFLLFDKFVLTNGHVVGNVYNESTGRLNERVTVCFSYDSLDQIESGVEVEEVAAFDYCSNKPDPKEDWALLRLCADQKLPDGLLRQFGFLPQSGWIYIIGHPDDGVKMMDRCMIFTTDNRQQVVERHRCENPEGVLVQSSHYGGNSDELVRMSLVFFDNVAESVKRNIEVLMYESCFLFGSSGSPVFDEHCNVVAMHSGGYPYFSTERKRQSVIEYGYPLSVVIKHIIVQLVEKGRFDVLKKYLACSYARHQDLMSRLKTLVESRNLTVFQNAANNPAVINDESLKTFFEFLCQKEEPMDVD